MMSTYYFAVLCYKRNSIIYAKGTHPLLLQSLLFHLCFVLFLEFEVLIDLIEWLVWKTPVF